MSIERETSTNGTILRGKPHKNLREKGPTKERWKDIIGSQRAG